MSKTERESRDTSHAHSEILYDWNEVDVTPFPRVEVDDETLRDGLQSPSVREPNSMRRLSFSS